MFAYPKQAEFNRVVPKTKIYAHARASKRVRELFVAQIEEIVWKFKLSPETTNLPARNGINEIEIFEILLRTPELDRDVLRVIDKAIPFPLAFQLLHKQEVSFAASYKRPSEADASKWVTEATFQTAPQPIDTPRFPLPVALDLASLYERILRQHLPIPALAGESLPDHIARVNAIQAKKRERAQLEARLAKEKQFNRRVDMNSRLRAVDAELATLIKPSIFQTMD